MTNEIVLRDVESVRNHVGVWLREDMTFVRFDGRDVASWLQTQTSNDVLKLKSGEGHANALLDRKAFLQASFTLHRWEDEYWLITERRQADHLLNLLDAHLFLEDVRIENAGDDLDQIALQGPEGVALLAGIMGFDSAESLPREPYTCRPIVLLDHHVLAFQISETGEDGFVLVVPAGEGRELHQKLMSHGAASICPEARDVLRIEAGIPRFGIDMDSSNRLPETTLERTCVSYDKGCYLGQEVVAKMRTYSTPKFALMGLVSEDALPTLDTALYMEGTRVGTMKSAAWSPTLQRHIALAYLDRDIRAPGQVRSFSGEHGDATHTALVTVLPFYEAASRQERARQLYDEALARFESDTEDEDDTAIRLLQHAVLLYPTFEDAYEALGVILNRHHRVDEAISVMKRLETLNPDCIMAHTNLSVFYVAKGMIQEAEEEKAKAAVLQLRMARHQARAEDLAREERERIRVEAQERIVMFREVLDIDPDDPLATYGIGMAYMQLDQPGDAIPYLQHAAKVQKDYSAAYLSLGKCFEFLNRTEDAAQAYRKGIEAANRKGDLMPLREMERRLTRILHHED